MSDIGFGVESGTFKGFYKMTVKNQTTPVFQKLEKNEDGKWVGVDEASSMAGYLQGVKMESYEYRNEKVHQLVLELDLGDGGISKLEMNLNGISKGIINNLSNEEVFIGKKLSLRLYVKNDKPNCFCTLDDERMSWGVPVDQVTANWKDDSFWIKVFKQKVLPKADTIVDFPKQVLPKADTIVDTPKQETVLDALENDDLPF